MAHKAILALTLALAAVSLCAAFDEPFEYVEATDGAKLALYRETGGELGPVVLVHGLGSNRYNFLVGPGGGLANYLVARGFDVFIFEERGMGRSGLGKDNGFEQTALSDFPLILARVRKLTGRTPQAIGHSLGGMIIGAYLANAASPDLRAAVIVSSPYEFRPNNTIYRFAKGHPKTAYIFTRFPFEFFLRALAPLEGERVPYSGIGYAHGTVDGKVIREFARRGIEKPPADLQRDFSRFILEGCICSSDGKSYVAGFKRARVPILVLAGFGDEIAPPELVRPWFDVSASEDKSFVLVSRANGFSADAGHGDILVGRYAAREIYPLICRWLKER